MPAGDLLTQDKQIELWRADADRLLLGAGTDYHLTALDGLSMPEVRAETLERISEHGALSAGRELLSPRSFRVALDLKELSSATLQTRLDDLAKALRPSDSDLTLSLRILERAARRILGRPRRLEYAHGRETVVFGLARVAFEFVALDPRIYHSIQDSQQIVLADTVTTANGAFVNDGNVATNPVLSISGPATNPRITNAAEARTIRIDVALAAGDTLDLDVAARTVKLNGVSRYDLVRTDNQWWALLPGSNNLTYSRTGSTGSSTLTVTWRDAWLAL